MRRVFVLKRKKGENKVNNEAKTPASSTSSCKEDQEEIHQKDEKEEEQKLIYHFQILSWEDNDACPVESVLNFLDAVNECEKNEIGAVKNKMNKKSKIGPTIVHCRFFKRIFGSGLDYDFNE